MQSSVFKSIDRIGTGDVITLRRGTLALVLEPMFDDHAKVSGFTVVTIAQKEKEFQGDARRDDYIMMPRDVKSQAGISFRHQYPVSTRPEGVSLKDCLLEGSQRDVICLGKIPRHPFVNSILEKIQYLESSRLVAKKVRKHYSVHAVSGKSGASTPTLSVEDACKIGFLYPVFNYCVRSDKPDHTVTLEELHRAAVLFQKDPKDNTLRNLIDMQGFPKDFLLEHAREREILTDLKVINELRGQGVHELPLAFAVAQHLKGHVSDEALEHLNTQPYAKIAEVIIDGRKAFLNKYAGGSIAEDVPILRV